MNRRSLMFAAALALVALGVIGAVAGPWSGTGTTTVSTPVERPPGALTVLPDDGRGMYVDAIDAAHHDIRIEICVLEDPQILRHLEAAQRRGVDVRAIVDHGKYDALAAERTNLARMLTAAGGELHLSNPIFPRSFPKVIIVDSTTLIYGSACLDQTTFAHYRDFAQVDTDPQIVGALRELFDNDWEYSEAPGKQAPPFDPTPPVVDENLIVAPVNASARLVTLYQSARETLDVYTELLGNHSLESELVAAVKRGVHVRVITPISVNGATPAVQAEQDASRRALERAGVQVHVSGPEQTAQSPYMHARAAIVDGRTAYLGSISLSADSATTNREVGLILHDHATVSKLGGQFDSDYRSRTKPA